MENMISDEVLPETMDLEAELEQLKQSYEGINQADDMRLHETAHVALHFIILGPSDAETERTLSVQRSLQGLHGTNYRTGTLHARLLLHEPR
jgi:hypothetical protein